MKCENKIQLNELLRRDWKKELLRYPVADNKEVHVAGLEQSYPAQVWGDRSGALWVCFITNLPALAERSFIVQPGSLTGETDLETVKSGNRVWIQTTRFGLQFPLGHFSGDSIPAPVQAMRWADGTLFGGGDWFGEQPVEMESKLTAAGPVLAEISILWTWADGEKGSLRLELAEGDCQALWESWSSSDRHDRGWNLEVSGLGPLALHKIGGKKWKNSWGIERGRSGDVTLDDKEPGMLTRLTPWPDWWDDQAQTSWLFKTPDRGFVLQAASCSAGDWVDPEPAGVFASWDKRLSKMLALCRGEDGKIFFRIDQAAGWRKWLFGAAGEPVGRQLNTLKEYALDWPDTRERPFVFVNTADIIARRRACDNPEVLDLLRYADSDMDAPYRYGTGPGNDHLQNSGDDKAIGAWLLTGSSAVAEKVHLVERLRRRLNAVDNCDLMRYVAKLVVFFDLVSHSGLVSQAERRVFRAQMSYLGYKLADPATWSIERGYRSGATNMSVSYILNLGLVACAIPDHPEASRWAAYATAMCRKWLTEKAGTNGEWPESMHYTHVSMNEFLNYAIAARSAGFADLLQEGLIKRVMLYAAKLHAPPDPRGTAITGPILDFFCRRAGVRGMTPLGRAGSTGGSFGHYGLLARATAASDPAFSRVMQWIYRETGWNECYSNESLDALRWIYPDRELPYEFPDWRSELLSTVVLLRDRTGSAGEDYMVFDAGAPFTSPGEHGGLNLWFWKGVPLVSRFSGGYDERAEALISNVSRAVRRSPSAPDSWCDAGDDRATAFTSLPACDYAVLSGERGAAYAHLHAYPPDFPEWPVYMNPASETGIQRQQRQILYVRDLAAGSFLILRDRVWNEPGAWKLWTLSSGISAIGGGAVENGILPGNAFTATGLFGVDMDLFIASPRDVVGRTLGYRREYNYEKKLLQGFIDDQRLLHIDIPAGQACFSALIPRMKNDSSPAMEAQADGRIIHLRRKDSLFYIILSDENETVCADQIQCRGPAGLVSRTDDVVTLTLPVAGELKFMEYAVNSAGPVQVEFTAAQVTVRVPYKKATTRIVDLCLPGGCRLNASSASFVDPQLVRTGDIWRVQLIPEVHQTVTIFRS